MLNINLFIILPAKIQTIICMFGVMICSPKAKPNRACACRAFVRSTNWISIFLTETCVANNPSSVFNCERIICNRFERPPHSLICRWHWNCALCNHVCAVRGCVCVCVFCAQLRAATATGDGWMCDVHKNCVEFASFSCHWLESVIRCVACVCVCVRAVCMRNSYR